MKVTITPNQAALIARRNELVTKYDQAAKAATEMANELGAAVSDILTAIALDNGATPGVKLKKFSITKEGEATMLELEMDQLGDR